MNKSKVNRIVAPHSGIIGFLGSIDNKYPQTYIIDRGSVRPLDDLDKVIKQGAARIFTWVGMEFIPTDADTESESSAESAEEDQPRENNEKHPGWVGKSDPSIKTTLARPEQPELTGLDEEQDGLSPQSMVEDLLIECRKGEELDEEVNNKYAPPYSRWDVLQKMKDAVLAKSDEDLREYAPQVVFYLLSDLNLDYLQSRTKAKTLQTVRDWYWNRKRPGLQYRESIIKVMTDLCMGRIPDEEYAGGFAKLKKMCSRVSRLLKCWDAGANQQLQVLVDYIVDTSDRQITPTDLGQYWSGDRTLLTLLSEDVDVRDHVKKVEDFLRYAERYVVLGEDRDKWNFFDRIWLSPEDSLIHVDYDTPEYWVLHKHQHVLSKADTTKDKTRRKIVCDIVSDLQGLGYTQREIGAVLCVDDSRISRYSQDKATPNASTVSRIKEILDNTLHQVEHTYYPAETFPRGH